MPETCAIVRDLTERHGALADRQEVADPASRHSERVVDQPGEPGCRWSEDVAYPTRVCAS